MSRYESIFKVLSEEKRLKLLILLLKERKEVYVCELADALEESHYNISKYLKELKMVNLVREKRVGRGVLYSVVEAEDNFLKSLFEAILSIPEEFIEKNITLLRLRLSLREQNRCVIGASHPKWKELLKSLEDKS
ncbi:MAG: ArsR/SmtB family transcription factor [Dictyoglomus sp.]